MMEKQNEILDFWEENFQGKADSVADIAEEIKKKGYQREELEIIRKFGKEKYNNSMENPMNIITIAGFFEAVITGIYSFIIVSDNVVLEGVKNLSFIILLVLLVLQCAQIIKNVSKKNKNLRNRMLALDIVLFEKENEDNPKD